MNNNEAIIQNLKDAGCEEEMIIAFIEDVRENKLNEGLRLLATYRRSLLDRIHQEQKQIDCLDYLVYTMQKKIKSIGQ